MVVVVVLLSISQWFFNQNFISLFEADVVRDRCDNAFVKEILVCLFLS